MAKEAIKGSPWREDFARGYERRNTAERELNPLRGHLIRMVPIVAARPPADIIKAHFQNLASLSAFSARNEASARARRFVSRSCDNSSSKFSDRFLNSLI